MNIYLDDNQAARHLADLLRKAGHTVVRPAEAGLTGASDVRHFRHALSNELVLLTADRGDFEDLHDLIAAAGGSHSGLLLVRYENDPKRDMKPKHIVAAVGKLERSGTATVNQVIVLNRWR